MGVLELRFDLAKARVAARDVALVVMDLENAVAGKVEPGLERINERDDLIGSHGLVFEKSRLEHGTQRAVFVPKELVFFDVLLIRQELAQRFRPLKESANEDVAFPKG